MVRSHPRWIAFCAGSVFRVFKGNCRVVEVKASRENDSVGCEVLAALEREAGLGYGLHARRDDAHLLERLEEADRDSGSLVPEAVRWRVVRCVALRVGVQLELLAVHKLE